jgi:hypothetical protein
LGKGSSADTSGANKPGKDNRACPDTINPLLYRHARLNNIIGLFEVVLGIYQAMGYDVTTMSLIRVTLAGLSLIPYAFNCDCTGCNEPGKQDIKRLSGEGSRSTFTCFQHREIIQSQFLVHRPIISIFI